MTVDLKYVVKRILNNNHKKKLKWQKPDEGTIPGVNIPFELYISSVVVSSSQRLGRTGLVKIERLNSGSMILASKMHKKRCGDEKN